MIWEFKAIAINVVDGDTLDVIVTLQEETVDLGFRIIDFHKTTMEERVRLYGINTPERGSVGWAQAKEMVQALVLDVPLVITTVKPKDKYGRWLAKISTPTCPDVALALIEAGLGVPYFGGTKV